MKKITKKSKKKTKKINEKDLICDALVEVGAKLDKQGIPSSYSAYIFSAISLHVIKTHEGYEKAMEVMDEIREKLKET